MDDIDPFLFTMDDMRLVLAIDAEGKPYDMIAEPAFTVVLPPSMVTSTETDTCIALDESCLPVIWVLVIMVCEMADLPA